ncbi:hypothetical protein [Coxiella burnetii]|uniref:hypothetical protein n=1 Tax=Coxiella burnetii TaxID=777 RepID=UPI002231C090|nr:hypothetical protein [Coxiella burnetii]
MESYQVLSIETADKLPYALCLLLTFIGGGFLESVLAFSPKKNSSFLPVINTVFQFPENVLLKVAGLLITICPPVNIGQDQYQSDAACMLSSRGMIPLKLLPLFVLFGLYSSISEYLNRNPIRNNGTFRNFLCLNPRSPIARISFSAVNAGISAFGLTTFVEYCRIITGNGGIPFTVHATIVPLYMFYAVLCEYKGIARKTIYTFNEFMRSLAGNFHASDHLIFALMDLTYGKHNRGIGGPNRIYIILLSSLGLGALRAYDAYLHRFKQLEKFSFYKNCTSDGYKGFAPRSGFLTANDFHRFEKKEFEFDDEDTSEVLDEISLGLT